MQRPAITVDDFKAYYNSGEFDYTLSKYNDNAIQKNIKKADTIFAYNFFNDNEIKDIYCLLVAHYLLLSTQQGFSSSGIATSQSTMDISVSLEVPEWMKSNPFFYSLSQTTYGQEYLTILNTRKRPFIMTSGTINEIEG